MMTKKTLSYFIILTLLISLLTVTKSSAKDEVVTVDGFQISTVYKGFRTLYSVNNEKTAIKEAGLIYGLENYIDKNDMVINANSPYIKKFAATSKGISPFDNSKYSNATNYVMTMEYGDDIRFYTEKLAIKAYVIDNENNVSYSAAYSMTVYDVADYLYQNSLMNNEERHNSLYTDILSKVNSNYQRVKFNNKNNVVMPTQEVTTQKITTQQATTQQRTTAQATTQQATTQQRTTAQATTQQTTTQQRTTAQATTQQATTQQRTTAQATTQQVTTQPETINVPDSDKASGVPGKVNVSSDNWERKTEFNITINMYWGNNATAYALYQKRGKNGDYTRIASGTLEDKTPEAQSLSVPIKLNKSGTYYYKAEMMNKFGKSTSDELAVEVGSTTSSKILLDQIDDDGVANSIVTDIGTKEYTIDTTLENPNFTVISSNTDAVNAYINNGKLSITSKKVGRSGIKIVDNISKEERYFGVRVKGTDGNVPKTPNYLALGQVSEDSTGDLAFHRAISNDDTNKRLDMRYIYINGGPLENGWQSWNPADPGKRVRSYVQESLKLGLIPYFVYYNIPDGSESYDLDRAHINDKTYMEAYYKDLKFFLDTAKEVSEGETIGIILEPDFIGYMMQNANVSPDKLEAKGVEAAYSSGILKKGKDPEFENTLQGLVKSINYIINKTYSEAYFGWQFNTWSYSDGVPAKGLMHATENLGLTKGREFIANAANITADYYMSAGILEYGADFISIDKYGLDGAGVTSSAASDPFNSSWFWNCDLWNNYLHYTKTLHERTNMPVTLWQLPVGHINHSLEPNPYNNGLFFDHANTEKNYEDSAPTYFFGDTFEPGAGKRYDYFATNEYGEKQLIANGTKITYGSHMSQAAASGVTCILFGAGVGNSTDAVGNPPSDDYWWITKAQRYYKSPVYLND